jgi:hypothetical protein
MKRTLLAGLAVVATLCAGHAAAQSAPMVPAVQMAPAAPSRSIDQADVFLGVCQKPENQDGCVMYLAGYTNGALVQSLIDRQRPRYCIPQNLERREQLGAVIAWMKGHLENILEPTGAVVYKALIGAFPCK